MKKNQKNTVSLGDLIEALFEESKKVSRNRMERNFIVYAALKHLLRGKVQTLHPIALKA